MADERVPWTAVYQSRESRGCQERALVLDALEINYQLVHDGEAYALLVAPRDAAKAAAELADYDVENQGWPPRQESPRPLTSGVTGALGYAAALLTVFGLAERQTVSADWWQAGAMQAALVRDGEWWRTVTALSLHTDVLHLLSNLVFGALFTAFLCQQLGTGVAWCSMLLAGAAGNFANAVVQPPSHTSVGASTAVFGALGIMVALQWVRRGLPTQRRLRRWMPLIIGLLLLGYLGTSGTRTDVMAHLTGMAAGAVLGVLLVYAIRQRSLTARHQAVLAWTAPALLMLSWVVALAGS